MENKEHFRRISEIRREKTAIRNSKFPQTLLMIFDIFKKALIFVKR